MLASRLLRRSGCQLPSRHFIPAPPSLIHPRIRAFHASAPRKDVNDVLLYLPHSLLETLHIALPWYAAIPLSAFIVRGLLVTSLGSYVRSLTSRYIALQPLRHAMSLQIRDRMMKARQFTTPKEATLAITKEIRKETGALDKRWNCTLRGQFVWTFAQFPLFIMMAEVIRRMVGTKDGLLKMGLSAVGLSKSSDDSIMRGEYSKDVDINPWFDASLANEGFLWFPDLLVPDPSGVLPFMVSGLMFLNVYHTKNAAGNLQSPSKFSRRLRRVMLTLALLIGPLTLHVPAGMLLYWASSTTSVMVWNKWLDWRYPVVQGFAPCKRPLLMPPESTAAKVAKMNVKTSRR